MAQDQLNELKDHLPNLSSRGFIRLVFPRGVQIDPWGCVWIIDSWTKSEWITSIIFLISMICLIIDMVLIYFLRLIYGQVYDQLKISASDIPMTTFRTHCGYYKFLVMSFCFSNAFAAFMECMNGWFWPYHYLFVIVFIDDILVHSKTKRVQDQHLRERETLSQVLKVWFLAWLCGIFLTCGPRRILWYVQLILKREGLDPTYINFREPKFCGTCRLLPIICARFSTIAGLWIQKHPQFNNFNSMFKSNFKIQL